MKVLMLRGRRSRRQGQGSAADTAERGVTALGSGDGHWVPINVSAAAAHRLDVDGSTPLHSANHQHPVIGDTIALAVRDGSTGQRVFCAPGLSRFGAFEFDWMRQADCLLVDGQPAADDSEPDWVDRISRLPARHKVLFEDGTPLRREALAVRGIEMAYDGMEIEL